MALEVFARGGRSVAAVEIVETSGSAVADDSMVRYFEFMPFAETGQAYVEVLRVVLVRRAGDSVEYLPSPQVEVLERRNVGQPQTGPCRRDGAKGRKRRTGSGERTG